MDVFKRSNGSFAIIHAGREIDKDFATEDEAWSWADRNIDDQMFDGPNWLAEPLAYRTPPPTGRQQ
jgi:hypothetical protein